MAQRGLRTVRLRTSGSSMEFWEPPFASALIWGSVALAKSSQLLLPSTCSVPDAVPGRQRCGIHTPDLKELRL